MNVVKKQVINTVIYDQLLYAPSGQHFPGEKYYTGLIYKILITFTAR